MTEKQYLNERLAEPNIKIRLADIISFLKKYIILLVVASFASAVVAYLISLTLTKTYQVNTLLLPEYSMGTSSFFNLGSKSSEGAENLVPDLYPTVLGSIPFGIFLLKQPVVDRNNVKYPSLENFLKSDKPRSGFFSFFSLKAKSKEKVIAPKPIQLPNKEILSFSKEQDQVVRSAVGLVSSSIDKKSGIITIESEMADPVVASQVVEAGKNYLMDYVESYRTEKVSKQTEFLEQRVREARRRLSSAEYALQSYRDNHRDAFLNVARIEEQRLQAEYNLSQSLYADLNLQLEQSIIKVKNEKPVFKVLEPARIPLMPSSPKKLIIALISAVIGGILCLIYILLVREKVYKNFL